MVKNLLIPSLNQPGNIRILNQIGYDQTLYLYCPNKYAKEYLLERESFKSLNNYVDIQVKNFDINHIQNRDYGKLILRNNLIDFIKNSLDAMSSTLTADMIIGDQSLNNMVKIIGNNDICLASAHARVNYRPIYDFFSKFFQQKDYILSNKLLVKKSIEHLHNSLKFHLLKDDIFPIDNHIMKLNENTYQVRCSRINVAFQRFNKSDIRFFEGVDNFNWIDRLWPRKLMLENRYRLVSDSDIYFFCVLTKEDIKFRQENNDWFQKNLTGENNRTINYSINDTINSYWKT